MIKQIWPALLYVPMLLAHTTKVAEQRAYMVWDKTCPIKVEPTEKLYMDAPMIDGKPDMKRAVIHGLAATYDQGCGRYEIRKPAPDAHLGAVEE